MSEAGPRDFPEVADVVATILARRGEAEQLCIVEYSPKFATLLSKKGRVIRVIADPIVDGALTQILDQCLTRNPPAGTEVVLVGGGSTLGHIIRAELPKMPRHPFALVHLAVDAPLRAYPDDTAQARSMLACLEEITLLNESELSELAARVERDRTRLVDDRKQAVGFYKEMATRKVSATYWLLGAIAALFTVQMSLGLDNPTAYAMGALHTPSVEAGEWWRVISAGFLHANLGHVGMNGFVLYLLGSQLERVVGGPRFLILYTAALIGGSFASMMRLTPEMISLGASGAIWGLLGAQTALAFGKPAILPDAVARSMKPMVMQNLLLNFGISFIGNIDWAAHFGGGLAAGLLLASGVLYPGADPDAPPAGWILSLAKACVAVMALGVFFALYQGQPWTVHQEIAQMMAVPPSR